MAKAMLSNSASNAVRQTESATEIITRCLFTAEQVHVYAIPPLQSNKGHVAATWTSSPENEIFTARLRVIETSDPNASSIPSLKPATSTSTSNSQQISISINLDDASTGSLFAGAPYISPNVVEPTIDSSRFFALRVVDESGRKAVLGLGFEDRSIALDFGITLQQSRKILGMSDAATPTVSSIPKSPMLHTPITPTAPRSAGLGPRNTRGISTVPGRTRPVPPSTPSSLKPAQDRDDVQPANIKRDWTLKPGQMIHVDLPGKSTADIEPPSGGGLKSPSGLPSAGAFSLLPPPPPVGARKVDTAQDSQSGGVDDVSDHGHDELQGKSLEELGFDDGDFGEFQ